MSCTEGSVTQESGEAPTQLFSECTTKPESEALTQFDHWSTCVLRIYFLPFPQAIGLADV